MSHKITIANDDIFLWTTSQIDHDDMGKHLLLSVNVFCFFTNHQSQIIARNALLENIEGRLHFAFI